MIKKELLNCPLFSGIHETDIDSLLSCLRSFTKKYKKDEYILNAGDFVNHVGVLLSGSALVIKDDYWGNRTIIKEVNVGELFAEVYACIKNHELEISLLANSDCEILYLDIDSVTCACGKGCRFHQQIIQNLLMIVAQKNLLLTQKMEHLSKRTMREKILSYLSAQSIKQNTKTITVPFDRQQLADYLAVNRSALSIELSKMQKEGILSYHKNKFTLK